MSSLSSLSLIHIWRAAGSGDAGVCSEGSGMGGNDKMTTEELLKAKIACPETGIEIHKSICAICDPQHCGLDLYVKDGRIIKVEGNKNHPNNNGALCAKGASTCLLYTS